MFKRIGIILSGVIMGCTINAFADTTESEFRGSVTSSNAEIYDDHDGIEESYIISECDKGDIDVSGEMGASESENILGEWEASDVDMYEISEENETEEKEVTVSSEDADLQSKNKEADLQSENKEAAVINVSFPEKIQIYLDPERIQGKGDIYSDEYKIVNHGDTDVIIRIKKTNVFYKKRRKMQGYPEVEGLNVDIVWDNGVKNAERSLVKTEGDTDEYVLYLKASGYNENEDNEATFHFTGTIDEASAVQWDEDNLALQFTYKVESAEKAGQEGPIDDYIGNDMINENEQYILD